MAIPKPYRKTNRTNKNPKNLRRHKLNIHCTDEENELLNRASSISYLPLGIYLRKVALEESTRIVKAADAAIMKDANQ